VNDQNQSDEVKRLQAQLAELTRRVYHLEGVVGARTESDTPAHPETPSQPEKIIAAAGSIATSPLPPSPVATPILRQPGKSKASLESQIGGQWLNRIGIIAVLIGLSYFLKLAFENGWIGPAMQVLIGMAVGVGLMFWSERFRSKGYAGFAYSLKAVGVGALYLSLWAASQYYHLISPTITFAGMVAVTLITAALSLRQNAELLAGFALVGGFLTPVLISTGQNHEIALFTYLVLLNLGALWISTVRRWPRLLFGAYIGTALLFIAWAMSYYSQDQLTTTFFFASFFFLLFQTAPFCLHQPPEWHRNLILLLVLLNAAGYLAGAYLMLIDHHRSELAQLLGACAILFLVLARILERRNLNVYAPLHVALAVSFVAVSMPVKAHGPAIAAGWLFEGGALIWASHRTRSHLLRIMALAILGIGILHLLLVDSDAHQALLVNPRFGLYLLAIAGLALLAYYAQKEGGEQSGNWVGGAILALNLLALIAFHFEVMDFFQPQGTQYLSPADWRGLNIARDFTYSAIWMLYGSGLMLVGFWKKSAFLRWQAIGLLVATAAKVFFYDISALERGYRIAAFIVLGTILLAVSFFYQRLRVKTAE
jgi:uncharacterized membrane protein